MVFLRGSLFKFCRVQRNEVASRICNDGTEKSCQLSENVIDHSCLKDGKFNLFFSSFLPFTLFFAPGLVRIHWQWKSTQLYNYRKRVFCKQWKSISPKQLWLLSGENYFISTFSTVICKIKTFSQSQ